MPKLDEIDIQMIGLMTMDDWARKIFEVPEYAPAIRAYYERVTEMAKSQMQRKRDGSCGAIVEYPEGNLVKVKGRWDDVTQAPTEMSLSLNNFIMSDKEFTGLTSDNRQVRVQYGAKEQSGYVSAPGKGTKGVDPDGRFVFVRSGHAITWDSDQDSITVSKIEGGKVVPIATHKKGTQWYEEGFRKMQEIDRSLSAEARWKDRSLLRKREELVRKDPRTVADAKMLATKFKTGESLSATYGMTDKELRAMCPDLKWNWDSLDNGECKAVIGVARKELETLQKGKGKSVAGVQRHGSEGPNH